MLTELSRNKQVKEYTEALFCPEPFAVKQARLASDEAGLKKIHISENVGKMFSLLTKIHKPKRLLEIGTLGAYSTLWFAGAMAEEAKIVTIEYDPEHAKIARENIERRHAGPDIELIEGDAEEILSNWSGEPFDMVFIDADKKSYPDYLELVLSVCKKGSLILADDLIPKRGEIGDPDPRDGEAVAIYTFNQLMRHHPRLDSTLFTKIVGEKGRIDAFGVAVVIS